MYIICDLRIMLLYYNEEDSSITTEYMIIILPDLWYFMELICDAGIDEAKKTRHFRMLTHLYNYNEINIGIPYWTLFDDNTYIDYIINDEMCINIYYDKILECFVFKSLVHAFYGIHEIFKKLYKYCDLHMYHKSRITMQMLQESYTFNDVCDIFSRMNL